MARQERERRYISDYMLRTFPDCNYQLNVELGPIPSEYVRRMGLVKAAALFRPTRPRVDAVAWEADRYILLEAKVRDIKNGIGDLTYYRGLIPRTPDLPYYTGQPVVARLIVPWMLEWLNAAAAAVEVEVEVDYQEWIGEYVRQRQLYFTAEYRAARAEKKRLREILGVD